MNKANDLDIRFVVYKIKLVVINIQKKIIISIILAVTLIGCISIYFMRRNEQTPKEEAMYHFPVENQKHAATWLTWPHPYTYGKKYFQSIEPVWIEMVKALAPSEKVKIVAYDTDWQKHIEEQLASEHISLDNVEFLIAKTDDVWIRDTGPIFAYDQKGKRVILDFFFDGWGEKAPYNHDNQLPIKAAKKEKTSLVTIDDFVLEGGSVELSEDGTLLATKSSVISKNRNPGMTQKEAEGYLRKYLGAKRFIWLEGVTDEDITDAHIDGFARFYDANTLLTVYEDDFLELYEKILPEDYEKLTNSTNAAGDKYEIIEIPMTKNNVKGLSYKGSYLNYYIANEVILLPVYNDSNDEVAINIMKELYQDKQIVPIDVSKLYKNGGMIHCVTQQEIFDEQHNNK